MNYPVTAGFKENTTSRDAALSIDAKTLRGVIREAYRRAGPMTADEAALACNISPLSSRPRVTEMARLGILEATGERRENASGRKAKVWRLAA